MNRPMTAAKRNLLVPGMLVVHPDRPDWGIGQIQSVDNDRITVNFLHAGKRVINAAQIDLVPVDPGSEQLG